MKEHRIKKADQDIFRDLYDVYYIRIALDHSVFSNTATLHFQYICETMPAERVLQCNMI